MNKIFHIGSTFKAFEEDNDLHIAGMASTNGTDRVGDVIETEAWTKGGLNNYLNNPVILFNHDYNQPIGRAIALETNDKGLQLKAKIAKSAGHVGELIKEGVLGAFSVGFRVKDAEYMTETDGYKIKDAELLEVSVVTVPANQAATFSLAKSFSSVEEYEAFKKSFNENDSEEKHIRNIRETEESVTIEFGKSDESMPKDFSQVEAQENNMSDNIDIDAIVAAAVEKTATAMAMKEAERKAEEKQQLEAQQKASEEAEAQKAAEEQRIATAVTSGAEKLMADVEAKMAEKDADYNQIIEEMKGELQAKSEEIQQMQESKRVFANRGEGNFIEKHMSDFSDAHLLGVVTGKGWNTDFAKNVFEKVNNMSGVAVGTSTTADIESEVSRNVEKDIELELVLDPLFRKLTMNAASMVIPTMPDTGYAEWNNAAGAGSGSEPHGNLSQRADSVGSPYGGIDMTNKVITTSKLISRTFLRNETEEDAIIPILPLIRDAMVRSHARAIEHSLLMGNATAARGEVNTGGPNGLVKIADDQSKVLDTSTSPDTPATAAKLLDMRQEMGKYGRRPSDVIYLVSLEAYYDLLDDQNFDDLNLVGDRATKITGEIGSVYGSPVIVCDEFAAGKDENEIWGVAVNPRNFVVPVLRGVTVESDYEVANQHRVLVASQRRGFDQLFSTVGQVVAHAW